jgi:hypothetical protein
MAGDASRHCQSRCALQSDVAGSNTMSAPDIRGTPAHFAERPGSAQMDVRDAGQVERGLDAGAM